MPKKTVEELRVEFAAEEAQECEERADEWWSEYIKAHEELLREPEDARLQNTAIDALENYKRARQHAVQMRHEADKLWANGGKVT